MKILIAVEGSKCSEAAVREAASQTWPEGTEVRLLYALELYPRSLHGSSMLPPEHYEELESLERGRSKNFLEQAAAVLRRGGFDDDRVTTSVVLGPATKVILEEADAWPADLIVLGTHGDGWIGRLVLGSVAHSVLLHAPCSVRIVREKDQAQ